LVYNIHIYLGTVSSQTKNLTKSINDTICDLIITTTFNLKKNQFSDSCVKFIFIKTKKKYLVFSSKILGTKTYVKLCFRKCCYYKIVTTRVYEVQCCIKCDNNNF